jgi:peptidoglycan L-alanyl-D-glutamate endopeptidase CwlK
VTFSLSKRSLDVLKDVHPDLVKVVRLAIKYTSVDFVVIEGKRTEAKQKKLVASGASQTMNSRHLTGHAVDLAAWVAGEIRWDWGLYLKLAEGMKQAAKELGIKITWGGDWKMRDGPHFELSWSAYPKSA